MFALSGRQLVLWCSVDQAVGLRLAALRNTGRECPHVSLWGQQCISGTFSDRMGLTRCAGAQTLGTSELQTLFNSVNAMCGIGLLATPFALAEMGWLALVLMLGEPRAYGLGIRAKRLQALASSRGSRVWQWLRGLVVHVPSCAHRSVGVKASGGRCRRGRCLPARHALPALPACTSPLNRPRWAQRWAACSATRACCWGAAWTRPGCAPSRT